MEYKIIPFCQDGHTDQDGKPLKHRVLLDGICVYCNEVIDKNLNEIWHLIKKLQKQSEEIHAKTY